MSVRRAVNPSLAAGSEWGCSGRPRWTPIGCSDQRCTGQRNAGRVEPCGDQSGSEDAQKECQKRHERMMAAEHVKTCHPSTTTWERCGESASHRAMPTGRTPAEDWGGPTPAAPWWGAGRARA